MHYLSNFFEDRIKRDLFYRYSYINSDQIPKILKVTLDINLIKKKYKHLTSLLLALEILSMKKSEINNKIPFKVSLKYKKGSPINCNVVLKNKIKTFFIAKIINEKQDVYKTSLLSCKKTYSFSLGSVFKSMDLKANYNFFKHVPSVSVTVYTNTRTTPELLFLLKSYKKNYNLK